MKIRQFIIRNSVLAIFALIVALVGFISVLKYFRTPPTYIYVRVKVGQGLWWAQTAKPTRWFIDSIISGDREFDIAGRPIAEITAVRYYPVFSGADSSASQIKFTNQFDVYMDVKLKVTVDKKSGKAYFKRLALAVGSPIEFEFSKAQISGTIIGLKSTDFTDRLIKKTIILSKSTTDNTEFDAIGIGEKYFDGRETVFSIKEKYREQGANYISADIWVRKDGSSQIYGEEEILVNNKITNFLTDRSVLYGYKIERVME